MCGIAGLILPEDKRIDPDLLSLFSKKLEHRGPDDFGFLGWRLSDGNPLISRHAPEAASNAHIAFVHRRLTIIDESEGGWQPMSSPCGRYAITFNGEIYNYLELKAELKTEGLTFRSESDTEVLLQALAHWGIENTLPRLTGMFAFAFLDCQTKTITLGRDPFGIKPLNYTPFQGGLAFASELPALLALPGLSKTVKPQALYNYLRFGMTDLGAGTLFSTIKHLEPAHFAVLNIGSNDFSIKPQRYWAPSIERKIDISFSEAAEKLQSLFEESVALHLRADVPVGAALSGGIDSSAVVLAMRKLQGSSLNLHTFSFIAPGEVMDEESWADMAGQTANANMHKINLSGQELVQDLDQLISTQGEPFGTTSIYAQNRVFALARQHNVPVTLDGQGADEILAGYVPYLAARLATMLKKGELLRANKFLSNAIRTSGSKGSIILRAMRFMLPTMLQGPARRLIGEELVPGWMNSNWFEERGVTFQAQQKPVAGDVLHYELKESLVGRVLPSLLRYQDRNSMAHSIESRVPFLTTKLVDFVYSLPEEYLISDQGETKAVFRAALRGLVPDAILDRHDKVGFATPEERWMGEAGDWLDDVLQSERGKGLPVFERNGFQSELEAVRQGNKPLKGDVWRWVNLIRWADQFDAEFA
ncbi:MAG: asparagine synthase (glutamine-hydrolyzing) [Rhodospirillales bacterium]|nr:asparagine synthase (glutamine-hydrolyzing) [Rhodospirillales bacterium]